MNEKESVEISPANERGNALTDDFNGVGEKAIWLMGDNSFLVMDDNMRTLNCKLSSGDEGGDRVCTSCAVSLLLPALASTCCVKLIFGLRLGPAVASNKLSDPLVSSE